MPEGTVGRDGAGDDASRRTVLGKKALGARVVRTVRHAALYGAFRGSLLGDQAQMSVVSNPVGPGPAHRGRAGPVDSVSPPSSYVGEVRGVPIKCT